MNSKKIKDFIFNNNFLYYFYKLIKIWRNKKKGWYLSEFAEDVLVFRLLKKFSKGIYVDIGAYHPFKGSLTYKLYQIGWRGLNIDISKISIDLFNMTRSRDININCAISNQNGSIEFFENSKINQQNTIMIEGKEVSKLKKIDCYELNSILQNNKISNFDYLNIDVEGAEMKVLEGLNLSLYRPRLITLEINDFLSALDLKNQINKHLISNNYILINRVGVTNFYYDSKFVNSISDSIKIN